MSPAVRGLHVDPVVRGPGCPNRERLGERSVVHLLVDLTDMMTDRLLELVGVPGGPLADASLWHLEVIDAGPLTPKFHRVVLTAPGLDGLSYMAGQDLMFRIPLVGDRVVKGRYTIRAFDPIRAAVTIDVSLHGAGPGTDWIRSARTGDRIDAIGPRGKITLREDADWHLCVGYETGLPGALAMLEALPPLSVAVALLEIDTPADEQEFRSDHTPGVDVRWVHRFGRSEPGDPSPILEALEEMEIPPVRDTPTWLPRLESYVALAVLWLHEVSERIRFLPRRTGGVVFLMQSTESRLVRTEGEYPGVNRKRFRSCCAVRSSMRAACI